MAGAAAGEEDSGNSRGVATWHADVDSGTLQGWGTVPAYTGAPLPGNERNQTQPSTQTTNDPAGIEPAPATEVDTEVPGSGQAVRLEKAESPEEVDDNDKDSTDGSDSSEGDELKAAVAALQKLLCDNAAFVEACEAAVLQVTGKIDTSQAELRSATDLRDALNHIYAKCEIVMEEIDDDEAADLFDGPMDTGVFYQLAREYFGSLCRTLSMDL